MAMSSTKLRDELVAAGLHATELSAIVAWALAWKNYFADAVSNAIPILPAILPAAESAMAAAMTGLSVTGSAAIQAGISAWWVALAPPASVFAGATLITPPPGLAAIAADILLAAPLNVIQANDAQTSLGYIAGGGLGGNLGLHNLNITGATATFPGPIVAPIL